MSTSQTTSDELSRNLLILYATETGNAQEVADRIARSCRSIYLKSRVVNMQHYPPQDLVMESLVVFVVSTTGSGVEPRSMTPLWNMLLSAHLPTDLFEDLSFAVFGLGDTAYEKFCWPAKLLSKRLRGLGAMELCERGEGDEQHPLGIDDALEPWLENLRVVLTQAYPLPDDFRSSHPTKVPPPRVVLSLEDCANVEFAPDNHSPSLIATVRENKRITAEDWFQDVRHIVFHLEEDVEYQPGDIAIIRPIAAKTEVEEFLASMNWNEIADEPLSITQRQEDQSLPDSLPYTFTLRSLFTNHLDFNAVPRRTFFQYLHDFSTDEMERERLQEFLSREGADELYDYCYRVKRTIKEILTEFRHVTIPKDYVFDVFPFLRPRQFSIASSIKKHPREVHLCVAIVRYRTKLKIPRRGVCTSYLAMLKPGDKVPIKIQKGLLRLPPPHIPVICIGPGTGIAPMRALIEYRLYLGSRFNTLYFGCRSATKDEHYKEEWKMYTEGQGLVYRVALSRDGPEGVKRTYVQDLITEDASRVWKLIDQGGAWVYISGSSNKMPAGVKVALAHVVETEGYYSHSESKKYVDNMVREGRLLEECWS